MLAAQQLAAVVAPEKVGVDEGRILGQEGVKRCRGAFRAVLIAVKTAPCQLKVFAVAEATTRGRGNLACPWVRMSLRTTRPSTGQREGGDRVYGAWPDKVARRRRHAPARAVTSKSLAGGRVGPSPARL